MGCVFCDDPDIQARCITRTQYSWAVPTNIPITPMHTLVMPIRHVETIDELTEEERADVLALRSRIVVSLKTNFGVEGFNFAWNEGELAGQSVKHLHMHIVPRTTGDAGVIKYEPREFLYRPGSRAATPEAELQAVAAELRAVLA